MTYQEALDFMMSQLPMFQRVGTVAFKKNLDNTLALCEALGNPQQKFKSIHIAGTNGKGSSSHFLAAILQESGYKTGLYTSPHLKNFTERIKINGKEIDKDSVVSFIEQTKPLLEKIKPSFFEMTVAMAFDYFAKQKVDIAIIEVGLGGRLDSTNVITPLISLITNISYDHQNLLGDTLPQIAGEKAGIIKENTPTVVSELQNEVANVFVGTARQKNSPLFFAESDYSIFTNDNEYFTIFKEKELFLDKQTFDLKGSLYQQKNILGVLKVVEILKDEYRFVIPKDKLSNAIAHAAQITGLKGRWQKLSENPLIIADTGHNEAGIKIILKQIEKYSFKKLHFVFGVVNDKDLSKVLSLLPKNAYYYFCQAQIPRAMDCFQLFEQAREIGLQGEVCGSVNQAIITAKKLAKPEDMILIGGSTFVVAEVEEL